MIVFDHMTEIRELIILYSQGMDEKLCWFSSRCKDIYKELPIK